MPPSSCSGVCSVSRSSLFGSYSTTAGLPLIQLLLRRRIARGKEDPARIDERRGIASLQRPEGPLVWLHAASIGEAQSVLILIDRLVRERPALNILVTTGTVTSASLMAERLPNRALHQFVPVDRPAWVRRFLDYWRPDLALWVESELWPNLLLETAARGIPMVNILALDLGETITAAVAVPDFEAANYCTMATRAGKIKRVALPKFASVRPSGLIAISLAEGDVLGWVQLTSGDDEIIIVTEQGRALRYHERAVRAMGRPAAGVRAIKLQPGDFVTGMNVADPDGDLLVVMANGYGKRTPISEYLPKGRGTMGVLTLSKRKMDVTGSIASARVVHKEDGGLPDRQRGAAWGGRGLRRGLQAHESEGVQ